MAASVYLPEEIFTDILVRLPVKSLVRFRCVCKSWCFLINNSDFARMNLNYLKSMEDDNHISILSIRYSTATIRTAATGTPTYTINSTTTFITNDETSNKENTQIVLSVKEVDCPVVHDRWEIWTLGSVDGILCLASCNGSMYLWNPSINKCKRLPPPDIRYSRLDVCGIGYDPSIDDYKVLWAHRKVLWDHRNGDPTHSPIQVLALKSNSWKTIQDNLSYQNFPEQESVFTNGGIHWWAHRNGATRDVYRENVIVCFDVVTEKFGEMPLPSNVDHNRLFVVGGNLSVLQNIGPLHLVHVWVMQEYGVRESWVKLTTITRSQGWMICLARNGQVLFDEGSSTISMYNPRDKTYKRFQIENGTGTGLCRMIANVETLVSPIRW